MNGGSTKPAFIGNWPATRAKTGSATPMRGKFLTCRKAFLAFAVEDRRVEDP